MSLDIVYFSNKSENTHRFVKKLGIENNFRIPLDATRRCPYVYTKPYVLFVPTYGAGNDGHSIPWQVKEFLYVRSNRDLLRGIVGFGNTNFGTTYCKAADLISAKTGVPVLAKIELLGMPEDVELVKTRMRELNEQLQLP